MFDALEFVESQKHPAARMAAAAAMWLRTAPPRERERDALMAELVAAALDEAWRHPKTPRMTLTMLRATHGWNQRDLARILGISPVQYNLLLLGRRPVSREEVEKIAAAKEVPLLELQQVLLITHVAMIGLETAWEMTWQETLAPLSPRQRREKVLADKNLQNWGLGTLLCDKCLEAGDADEAVTLAELALLIAEHLENHREELRRRHQAYAWGHLGHALQRRGDSAAAETAFAESIELWTSGEDVEPEDRTYAERLVSIVPSFPPYVPPPRTPRRKTAKKIFR